MTQPMTPERLAEIRELYEDAKAHGCFISMNDTGELLAEIDRLSNDYAALVKFNNAQIDLTHEHIHYIAALRAQLKSAREIIQMASGIKPDWKISIDATKWLKENPA